MFNTPLRIYSNMFAFVGPYMHYPMTSAPFCAHFSLSSAIVGSSLVSSICCAIESDPSRLLRCVHARRFRPACRDVLPRLGLALVTA